MPRGPEGEKRPADVIGNAEPSDKPRRLSPTDCHRKAEECRKLATLRNMSNPERIMLQHIADTWERIAATAKGRDEPENSD